jgi:hypothetical protein
MSGMAEVLAAHQWYDATTDNEDPATGCTGCPEWFGSEDALDDGSFANHQADMLTAAGFGDVREAGAQALEEAAAEVDEGVPAYGQEEYADWLRARAAAVRGDG